MPSIVLPEVPRHPNRTSFIGVLSLVNTPSRTPPNGSRFHRVLLKRDAVEQALSGLLGMGLNKGFDWEQHDPRTKCGVITHVGIVGQEIRVGGIIYTLNFPEFGYVPKEPLGMSYEIANVGIEDMEEDVWVANRFFFTGAAVSRESKCASGGTRFDLLSNDFPDGKPTISYIHAFTEGAV